MKLSTKGRYGLRAMIDIAALSENETVPISDIALKEKISEGYLEKIVALLKKAKLVASKRGAKGGYYLYKSAKDISVGDVLRALEGDLSPVECVGIEKDGCCDLEKNCVTKYVWQKMNESINKTADSIKLDILVKKSKECKDGECGC